MVNLGSNPFIVGYDGNEFNRKNLGYLSNLPSQQSVYFTTQSPVKQFKDKTDFLDPWFYKSGVFDGKFGSVIGLGASGVVLSGEWSGKRAAFKFVKIETKNRQADYGENSNENLSEMTSIQATKGSRIVSFYGHYRLVDTLVRFIFSLSRKISNIGNNFMLTTIRV